MERKLLFILRFLILISEVLMPRAGFFILKNLQGTVKSGLTEKIEVKFQKVT